MTHNPSNLQMQRPWTDELCCPVCLEFYEDVCRYGCLEGSLGALGVYPRGLPGL